MSKETIRKILWITITAAMLIYMVALGVTIFFLASETLSINQDMKRTLDGIKLLCPEEQIKEDGVPVEKDKNKIEYDLETMPTEVVNYDYDYVRATCYTNGTDEDTGICYDGTPTYFGCLSGSKEQLGKKVILLDTELNYLGKFEFHDTGNPEYVNSQRIDIWQPNLEAVNDWIKEVGDYVYIIYI